MASTSSQGRPCRKLKDVESGKECRCRGWVTQKSDLSSLYCSSCGCHESFHEPYLPPKLGIGRCAKVFGKSLREDGCQEFYPSVADPHECAGCGCHINMHEEIIRTELRSKRLKLGDVTIPEVVEQDAGNAGESGGPGAELSDNIADSTYVKYKVFLSHSGAQKDFVNQLYHDLTRCDRRPFFDISRDCLPEGKDFPSIIFEAIKKCQVGVLILTKEFFTRSKWPMLEMVAMMKENEKRIQENKSPKIHIIPIFLGVSCEECSNPLNHISWISQWKTWANSDTRINIEEWKKTLKILGPNKGLVFNNRSGEVEFRKEIVDAICNLIYRETRWDDSEVQGKARFCKEMLKNIEQVAPSSGVRMVGLYGMGGIGKTTLCHALCNDVSTEFCDKVCHVELESTQGRVQLGSAQERVKILREVLKRLSNIREDVLDKSNEGECRGFLKKDMPNHRVFLVIDNVSDISMEQARTYRGTKLYGEGSNIIFTARSIDVLSKGLNIRECDCLEMPEMDEKEARSLFLQHAQYSLKATSKFDQQLYVSASLQRCFFPKRNGRGFHYHPLALKVLGGGGYDPQRCSKKLDNYDIFNPYQIPEHPIFSILRRSYDILTYEQKLLFMDVALFVPKEINNVKAYWTVMDWLCMMHKMDIPKELENLKRKSLLESFDDGATVIIIHDLWIEFCKAETMLGDPCCIRPCIRLVEECADLGDGWKADLKRICLINNGWINVNRFKGFSNVVVLNLLGELGWWHEEPIILDLSGMRCLKSLKVDIGFYFTYDDSRKDYGLGSLTNLVYLDWYNMRASEECIENIGCLTKLQFLALQYFEGEKLPDLSKLTSLRVARFDVSVEVKKITGLSELTNLQRLILFRCSSLRSCRGVGDLIALEELDLSHCHKLKKLPSHMGKLTKLRKLDLTYCKSMKSFSGLSELVALEELDAACCDSLIEFPHDLHKLTKLRSLHMDVTTLFEVPRFDGLISLEVLHANFALAEEWPNLNALPFLPPSLRIINICGWIEPGLLSNLTLLEELTIAFNEVDVLPDLQSLKRLQSLSIIWTGFKDLGAMCNLTSLHILKIDTCRKLVNLPDLHMLTNMKKLDVSSCDNLKRLPDTHFPTTLKTLRIKKCKKWEIRLDTGCITYQNSPPHNMFSNYSSMWKNCWPGVSNLTELESLEVEGFANMKDFPDINQLTNLRSLKLTGGGYNTVDGIKCLSQLEILKCFQLKEIFEIPDLSNFPRLKELKLHSCVALKRVTCREPLTALMKIGLNFCHRLEEIPDLSKFLHLEGLSVLHCKELMRSARSGPLYALKRERRNRCENLHMVPNYRSSCLQRDEVLNSRGIWEEDIFRWDSRNYWSDSADESSNNLKERSHDSFGAFDETSDASDGTSDASDGKS